MSSADIRKASYYVIAGASEHICSKENSDCAGLSQAGIVGELVSDTPFFLSFVVNHRREVSVRSGVKAIRECLRNKDRRQWKDAAGR